MAHLEVEPKQKRSTWIWIILLIILALIATIMLWKSGSEDSHSQRAAAKVAAKMASTRQALRSGDLTVAAICNEPGYSTEQSSKT